MADTVLVVTDIDRAGIADITADANVKATNAAAGGDYFFPNDGNVVLYVVVGGTGSDTYTFTAIKDRYGRTETLTPTPAKSTTAILGPYLPELWNNEAGRVKFNLGAGQADNYVLAGRISNPT